MPNNRTAFLNATAGAAQRGDTLFERMQRTSNAPVSTPAVVNPIGVMGRDASSNNDILVMDHPAGDVAGDVRLARAEVDGLPGIVMQQRQPDGAWREIWSLPTQSPDAREGMLGWFNTQSHRWDRFARMLQRRGSDELTSWIFELMVQPTAAAAHPPRLQPSHAWITIDQYHSPRTNHAVRYPTSPRIDDCVCRHNPRTF